MICGHKVTQKLNSVSYVIKLCYDLRIGLPLDISASLCQAAIFWTWWMAALMGSASWLSLEARDSSKMEDKLALVAKPTVPLN